MIEIRADGTCWPFVGYVNPRTGYGQVTLGNSQARELGWARIVTAPRLMCRLTYGPPPSHRQRYALHSCDNKLCCNPIHLRWGSQADNNADAWARTRRWGENHPNARYDDATVVAVLRDVADGMSVAAAAKKHDVNRWTAYAWTGRGGRPHAASRHNEEAEANGGSRGR